MKQRKGLLPHRQLELKKTLSWATLGKVKDKHLHWPPPPPLDKVLGHGRHKSLINVSIHIDIFEQHYWNYFTNSTRGVQYVMKTAQYIPKFYIYTLHNYFL